MASKQEFWRTVGTGPVGVDTRGNFTWEGLDGEKKPGIPLFYYIFKGQPLLEAELERRGLPMLEDVVLGAPGSQAALQKVNAAVADYCADAAFRKQFEDAFRATRRHYPGRSEALEEVTAARAGVQKAGGAAKPGAGSDTDSESGPHAGTGTDRNPAKRARTDAHEASVGGHARGAPAIVDGSGAGPSAHQEDGHTDAATDDPLSRMLACSRDTLALCLELQSARAQIATLQAQLALAASPPDELIMRYAQDKVETVERAFALLRGPDQLDLALQVTGLLQGDATHDTRARDNLKQAIGNRALVQAALGYTPGLSLNVLARTCNLEKLAILGAVNALSKKS